MAKTKTSMGPMGPKTVAKTPTNMGVPRRASPAGNNFAPGKAVDGSTIGGAIDELYHQHPHHWNDLGPHHMGRENEIHEPHPYSGLKPRTMRGGRSPALSNKQSKMV